MVDRSRTWLPRIEVLAVVLLTFVMIGLPIDQVSLPSAWRAVLLGGSALAMAVAVLRHRGTALFAVGLALVLHSIIVGVPVEGLVVPLGAAATGWWWSSSFSRTRTWRPVLLLPLILAVAVVGVEGVLQANAYSQSVTELLGASPRWGVGGETFRVRGTTGHPLPTAGVTISLLVAVDVTLLGQGRRLAALGVSGGAVAVALLTGTRSALIAIAAVALVGLASGNARLRRSVVVAVLVLVFVASASLLAVGLGVGPSTAGTLPRVLDFGDPSSEHSYSARSSGWAEVVDALGDRSFPALAVGTGKGSLGESARQGDILRDGPPTADNTYLTVAYEFGLLGLALAGCAVVTCFRRARAAASLWTVRTAGAGVSLAAFALTFDVIHWASTAWLMGVVAGALVSEAASAAPADRYLRAVAFVGQRSSPVSARIYGAPVWES